MPPSLEAMTVAPGRPSRSEAGGEHQGESACAHRRVDRLGVLAGRARDVHGVTAIDGAQAPRGGDPTRLFWQGSLVVPFLRLTRWCGRFLRLISRRSVTVR